MITLKSILANGGATLDSNGNSVNYNKGYQVSKQDILICPLYKFRKYMIVNLLNLMNDSVDYLGVWIDNGKAYVDISEFVGNKKTALKKGRENKQLSIYDWKNNTVVWCC